MGFLLWSRTSSDKELKDLTDKYTQVLNENRELKGSMEKSKNVATTSNDKLKTVCQNRKKIVDAIDVAGGFCSQRLIKDCQYKNLTSSEINDARNAINSVICN